MASNPLKSKVNNPEIKGTRPSAKNGQLLVSTGVPSLDNVIGGGIPVGSLFIVEEDTYGAYAKYVLKYFMAEGIVTKHALLVASQDVKPSQLVEEIPAVVPDGIRRNTKKPGDGEMQIAWRYQNMKVIDSSSTDEDDFGHYYDLTKTVDKDVIAKADITEWHENSNKWKSQIFENGAYLDLLKAIQDTLRREEFFVSNSSGTKNVLRIAIHSLGSKLWFCDDEESTHEDLLKFLYCLRAMLKCSYAVATITIPTANFDNSDAIVQRLEHLADMCIKMESFVGSPKAANPLFKDYHGLLHVIKLSALNTLVAPCPESKDQAFVLRKKKFLISILHLPPEFGNTAQREQDDLGKGCAGGMEKDLLDF